MTAAGHRPRVFWRELVIRPLRQPAQTRGFGQAKEKIVERKQLIEEALDTLADAQHGHFVRGDGHDALRQRLSVLRAKLEAARDASE